jgi:hypothetical protein
MMMIMTIEKDGASVQYFRQWQGSTSHQACHSQSFAALLGARFGRAVREVLQSRTKQVTSVSTGYGHDMCGNRRILGFGAAVPLERMVSPVALRTDALTHVTCAIQHNIQIGPSSHPTSEARRCGRQAYLRLR